MWTYEVLFSLSFLFFHTLCYLSAVSLTVLDYVIGIRLDAQKKILRLGALDVTSRIGGERFSRTSLL